MYLIIVENKKKMILMLNTVPDMKQMLKKVKISSKSFGEQILLMGISN